MVQVNTQIYKRSILRADSSFEKFYFYLPQSTRCKNNWLKFFQQKQKWTCMICFQKFTSFIIFMNNINSYLKTTRLVYSRNLYTLFLFYDVVFKNKRNNMVIAPQSTYANVTFKSVLLSDSIIFFTNSITSNVYVIMCLLYAKKSNLFFRTTIKFRNGVSCVNVRNFSFIYWATKSNEFQFFSTVTTSLITKLLFTFDNYETWPLFVNSILYTSRQYKAKLKLIWKTGIILFPLFQNFNIYYKQFSRNPLLLKKYLNLIYRYEQLLQTIRVNQLLVLNKINNYAILLFNLFLSLDIKYSPISNKLINKYRDFAIFKISLKFNLVQTTARENYYTKLEMIARRFFLIKKKKKRCNLNFLRSPWFGYFHKFFLLGRWGVKTLQLKKRTFQKYYYDLYNLLIPSTSIKKPPVTRLRAQAKKTKSLKYLIKIQLYTLNPYLLNCCYTNKRSYFGVIHKMTQAFKQYKDLQVNFLKFSKNYTLHQLKKTILPQLALRTLIFRSNRRDYIKNICFFILKKIYKRFLKNGRKTLAQKFFINFLKDFKYSHHKSVYTVLFNFIIKIKRGATVRPMFKSGITYQIPFALTFSKYLYFTIVYLLNEIKNDTNLIKCYIALKEILIIYGKQRKQTHQFSKKVFLKSHIFNNKMLKYCKYIKTHQSYLYTMFPF